MQKIEAYLIFIDSFRFLNKMIFLNGKKNMPETTSILVRWKFIFTLFRHLWLKRLRLLEMIVWNPLSWETGIIL